MDKLVYAALLSVCTAPLAALAGVMVGAWITHRSHIHQSPIPNVVESFRNLIAIVRPKKKAATTKVLMPRMRA